MKKIFLGFFLISTLINSQEIEFEKVTVDELKMTHYEKDSSANAVVLIEKHNITSNPAKYNRYKKQYYVKIKILNKTAFDLATVKIVHSKDTKLKNINGFTYNLNEDNTIRRRTLTNNDKFITDYNKNIKINSISFPNVKVGSIIEYSYTIESNFYSLFNCYFQSKTPKKKVIYKSRTLPQFYNSILIGTLRPQIFNHEENSDYESLHYEFKNIPAFIEEDFIDNKDNYISRIFFEKKYYNIYARKDEQKYGWGLIDEFFREKYNNKFNKVSFFKKVLPKTIKNEKDTLTKIIKVFNFIRNHYTLNNNSKATLTKSFKEKTGNSSIINLALYNSFKAANIKPNIVLLSTREHGFLTKRYPTYQSVNYVVTHIKIDNKDYFLDATDKNIPFGLVPFKCLNGDVRILDLENETYWKTIKSTIKTSSNTKINLNISESNLITGKIKESKKGQFAYNYRNYLIKNKEEDYLNKIESENINLSINNYKVENIKNNLLPIIENLEFSLDNDSNDESIIQINPFLINYAKENPLKLKERKYPVDFGFPFNKYYTISIKYHKKLKLIKLPKEIGFTLPNNEGRLIFKVLKKENEVNIFLKFSSSKKSYSNLVYSSLKELFNQLVKSQNSLITFQKI